MERVLKSIRRRVTQDRYVRLSADRAESLMPMESFVGVAVSFTQSFYLLHLAIVFFGGGKEIQQSGFKHLVRLGRPGKEIPSPLA